ncbi:MAG: zeta toxin family protein [Selenomonadaceae bacterium]|nr:zeta toxin family protein [Selenomonadaceae bacterium]
MFDDYSKSDFEESKQKVLRYLGNKFTPVNNPQAYMIVGQPGAGKSTLASYFTNKHDKNIIFINGDDFRKYHPNYDEIYTVVGDNFIEFTKEFSGKMTETLINELSEQKYNLIIEGTLRTVEVPIATQTILKENNYNVTLACMLVRPEISYLSTIKRYELMKEINAVPRKTPKHHHDLVLKSIIKNLDTIYNKNIFDNIQIYNRNSEILYDYNTDKEKNPAEVFKAEFFRKLSEKEINSIYNDFLNYVTKEEISGVINEYKDFEHWLSNANPNYNFR